MVCISQTFWTLILFTTQKKTLSLFRMIVARRPRVALLHPLRQQYRNKDDHPGEEGPEHQPGLLASDIVTPCRKNSWDPNLHDVV